MARSAAQIINDIRTAREAMEAARAVVEDIARMSNPGDADLARSETAYAEFETRQAEIARLNDEASGIRGDESGDQSGSSRARSLGNSRGSSRPDYDEAMRTIERTAKSGLLPGYGAEAATELIERAETPETQDLAARWAAAAGSEAYAHAFAKVAGDSAKGHLLWTSEEAEAYRAVNRVQAELSRASMSLTDGNGGYMVPLTLDPSIMLTSDGSNNPLRRISRVVRTTTDAWQGVTSAGVTAEWKAEAAQVSDASPAVASVSIPVHLGDAYVTYSYEIGMDAVGLVEELRKLLFDAADQLQAVAYTTGSGTGQPKGIITALAGTSSEINGGGTEALAAADAFTLQNALPARFSSRAQWMAHLATINTFRQFETTNGALKFPELADNPPRLLGRVVNENSNMDGSINAAATANNYLMVYGDFSNFIIVDRIGTTVEFVPQVFGANQRPTGQRGMLMYYRTGSDVGVANAFRMLDVPTTA